MSDVFETKKITELSESKSAADSDLLMVGNPSTGELSKITKENYLSEINEDLTELRAYNFNTSETLFDQLNSLPNGWTGGKFWVNEVSTDISGMPVAAHYFVLAYKLQDNYGCYLAFRHSATAIYYARCMRGSWTSWFKLAMDTDLDSINTSLSDLETRVAALEKAAGISANESPSSIEPGPEESGDDDGMTVAPDPEVLNDDE